jgi:HAD superfamily phosphatase (TIGR01668 family)
MKKLQREATTPRFVPDFMAQSVTDVDFTVLKRMGIEYIAFDADSTLVNYRGKVLSQESREYLRQNRVLFKGWCIASNRVTNDLQPLADSIDAKVIRATLVTRKPNPRFFARVVRLFNAKPQKIAMIGDKLIADMFGAKRAGFVTVWVQYIGPDSTHDRLLGVRRLERYLMKHYAADE